MAPWSARTLVVASLAAVSVAACSYDFDGLFRDPADADGGGTGGTADAGTTSGPDAASACGAETCRDEACTYACGDACACPAFSCRGGGTKLCEATCGRGATCDVACDADDCTFVAQGSTSAKFSCDDVDSCGVRCAEGASCEVACRADERCAVVCEPGASCLVACRGAARCDLDCPGGGLVTCPDGASLACNRPCRT